MIPKFRAWIKQAEIMIKDVAIYPDGVIGCEVNKIIEILDNKFEGQVYYDDERQSIEFGNDDCFIEVLPCEGEWVNIPAEEVVILQSTGLLDKNGTEIFEGYVISYEDEAESNYDGEIEIFRNTGQVFWEGSVCAYYVSNRVSIDMEDLWADPNIEVLGNIFENPELLKQPYANQR